MRKTLFFIALYLCFPFCYANSGTDYESIKERYSKYNAVILNQEVFYTLDVVKDSLVFKLNESKDVMILNSHSKAFTNGYIFYNGFTEIEEKEAYTLIPKGNNFTKIKVSQFKEAHNIDDHVFYDDSKVIQFSFPSLQKGAITHLEYTTNYKDPRFLGKNFLQSFIPILKSKITVKVHKNIKIGFKLFNDDLNTINFKQYEKGKYTYYEWDVEDVKPFKYSGGNNYSISYYSPHLIFYLDETNIKGKKKNYFGTITDLYKFYYDLLKNTKTEDVSELEILVNNITKGLTKTEKAKAIYYWVQDNIKYVAYEHGYMGFVPYPATEVLKKRYGDCKGMSNLITKMMEIAGLNANNSWVGTRSIPYSYEESPLISTDNHMISTYQQQDSIFIMDGTFKYLDFGVYPYHIQDKEVLIGKDSINYQIFKVPVSPSTYSTLKDSVTIRLSEESIIGKGKRTHKGFHKLELAYAMDGVNLSDYNKRFSKLFAKGNNKFEVTDHKIYNLFEHQIPAEVDYEFSLNDYCKTINNDIYINLNLEKSYQNFTIDTTADYSPIENDFYSTETYITNFEIPEGYEVSYIPKDETFENNYFSFSIKYTQNGNNIIMENSISFEFFFLVGDQISQWNQMIKKLNKQYRSSLVLKKSIH